MLTIVSYQTTLDIINIISNIEKNITINRYQRRNIDISALAAGTSLKHVIRMDTSLKHVKNH